ncbi:ABC transporter permease [bacterium]|nr:ABC transporter permease [bacterium]
MLGKVSTIAGNAFRETIRQPVFVVVLGVATGLIALSPTFSMFTLLESVRLVQDMGLSTILLASLLVAVLSASTVVSEEIRGRTALMVLARPVGRGEFVLGKFLGIALAQLVAVYLMSVVLVITVRIGVPEAAYAELDNLAIGVEAGAAILTLLSAIAINYFFDKPFPSAVVLSGLALFSIGFIGLGFVDGHGRPAPFFSEMHGDTIRACIVLAPTVLVLTAAAVAVATRLSLVTCVVGCTLFFVAGMLSESLLGPYADRNVAAAVGYMALPNFQAFWMGDALQAGSSIPWQYVTLAMGYAALYTLGLLFLGMLLFERREIQ